MNQPEPFLRWAGGKRQLLPVLHAALPKEFALGSERFFEPFIGGGALMFSLSEIFEFDYENKSRSAPMVINDVNMDLVATYKVMRDCIDELVDGLDDLVDRNTSDDYYAIRAQEPTTDLERAIRLIFLNRTGFNGLYRVNSKGKFNVPWGKLKSPTICNEPLLRANSKWLQNVDIRSGSFASACEDAVEGDLVYFDPPYIPISRTSSFSKYSKDDFQILDQFALAGVVEGLVKRGVRVMLSNSFTEDTVDIFSNVLDLRILDVTRSISAKVSSRGPVQEVIGISYEAKDCDNSALIKRLPRVTESNF